MTGNELLWPEGQKIGDLDFTSAAEDLELERLGALLFRGMTGSEAVDFAKNLVTDDWVTIKMRQDTINDLQHEPRLRETFRCILKLSDEIKFYAKGLQDNAAGLDIDWSDAVADSLKKTIIKVEKYISQQGGDMMEELNADNRYAMLLRSVLFKYELLKRYAEAMTMLRDTLTGVTVQSTALLALKVWVEEQYACDNVDGLCAKLTETAGWWKGLKAFAIDIYMSGRMIISGMEVAEVRSDPYYKNGMLDGGPTEPEGWHHKFDIIPANGLGTPFQEYLLSEVGYEARKDLLKLRSEVVKLKLTGQGDLISLEDALKFYLAASDMAIRFTERGVAICAPEYSQSKIIDVIDAVLPEMALTGSSLPIKNDCCLGAEGYVSLITGPNSSGKTCYIILAGQLIWLSQLGCLLPCAKASISPCDSLLTLFAAGESEEGEDSRMGMEVIRLKDITGRMTSRSLVLLNEPMTSTNAFEGMGICIDLISELIAKKVSGMMVTHFGDIYGLLMTRLTLDGVCSRFTSLVMTTAGHDGELTYLYKINEAPPMTSSHARAVIGKLGVTLNDMLRNMDKLGMDIRPDDPAWDLVRLGEVL